MNSSALITRTSAVLLAAGGFALLFGADDILPALSPGFPEHASWLGQLIGAGWIGVAALNWLNKSTLIGGIYGRPVVMANLILYFIGSMVLLSALRHGGAPALWWVAVPHMVMAIVYGLVLFKGPFEMREGR